MISCGRAIEQLNVYRDVARHGGDVEGVHQLRVAARRLDAWLRIGGHRTLRDDLRWLRRALAPARDLDVLLGWDLPESLHSWLETRRTDEQGRVSKTLDDDRLGAMIGALSLLPPLDEEQARNGARAILARVVRRGRAVNEATADAEAVHALRRSLRGLRFALEWLGDDADLAVRLQSSLGDFSDQVALAHWLAERADPGDAGWRARLHEEIEEERRKAVKTWQRHQGEVEAMEDRWTST